MGIDVSTIFYIAGIGIVIAMIHTVLKQAGKEDWAHWVTLIGFIVVLYMVSTYIQTLFQHLQRVFIFY
ncbi:MAG: stage III sporulation protein AC [Thermicanus sp.]|nr:stage III sporulation protein AC [Thermicanus sp.]